MSWTFLACVGIAFAWMALFFLWGRSFLAIIHAERDIASSVTFGYLVLQVLYQLVYLPFYLSRGSYYTLSYSWIALVAVISIILLFYLRNQQNEQKQVLQKRERVGICIAVCMILALAFYISLHLPFYGLDTRTYISSMNDSYYRGSIWAFGNELYFHYGMCSMFHFFTVPALLTGIKPYYLSLFTVRIVGICLFSLIVYRMGNAVFRKEKNTFSWSALSLSILAPFLMMFSGSNYIAEFFYWRINEAKGYCQFVLLPLGFSVFLEMFREQSDRKALWKKQFLVGLAAVAVSASSLTAYLFLLLLGTCALLAYDKLKNGWRTMASAAICAIPNLIYLGIYALEKNGVIVL